MNIFASFKCTFYLLIIISCLFTSVSTAQSFSDSSTYDNPVVLYTDYLPKYQDVSSGFMISKIEYTDKEIILFFHYVVAKDDDVVRFYGSDREFVWRLTNSVRSESSSVHTVTRLADVMNIRVNDESVRERLNDRSNADVPANKGDIITCEIHFPKLPSSVRTVFLLGGDCVDHKGTDFRFNCNGILLKSNLSGLLGSKNQMIASVKRFYDKNDYVKYPDIFVPTTLAQQDLFNEKDNDLEKETPTDPFEKHLAPISYMPHMLIGPEDLKCNERVILTDVHFLEKRPDFISRNKAMLTISLLIDFLSDNPDSKIALHAHTDIYGNAFSNLETSKQHVNAVKKVLITKGIDSERIIAIHHGGAQTLIRYKNGGSMNRRIEAEILCESIPSR